MKKSLLFIILIAHIVSFGSCNEELHGLHRFSLMHDGFKRFFNIYIPKSYDGSKSVPLVFDIHGIYQNAANHQRYTGFDKVAESENGGFIVVYPDGITTLGNPDIRSWSVVLDEASSLYKKPQFFFNWAHIVDNLFNETDDVGFIIKIVEEVTKNLKIDRNRIYLAGLSQGGALALRCAYEHSDIFAAVFASSSGMLLDLDRFQPLDPPIPVMKINAFEDKTVQYEGGTLLGGKFPAVYEETAKWAEINGCRENYDEVLYEYSTEKIVSIKESEEFNDNYGNYDICKTYTGCNSDVIVKQCSIHGKHDLYNYPAKDGVTMAINHWGDYDISEQAWSFLQKFSSKNEQ